MKYIIDTDKLPCNNGKNCTTCPFWSVDDTCEITEQVKKLPKYEDRPHGEWIPCSERLPKPNKYVLVCSDEGYIEVAEGYISTEIEEFVWLTSGWRFGTVIAWLPLPEPYKKEGEAE